jgi:hypothetical protein
MAEVFKAKLAAAAGTEKLVCIKRILPQLSRNQDFLSLFVKEAKIALPLTHGNITQVFDFGEENGVYYLAMEYIAGRNLHEVLKRVKETEGKLDVAACLHIAAEVCKGLQYAHGYVDGAGQRQIVVHRDVTPHNILISYNGEVKLTDFGIALAAAKVTGGDDGVVRGKACYLSPEQVSGHPAVPASDIFSLGAVLYEVLTGIRIFDAESEDVALQKVRALEVPPPSRANAEVDEAIDAIVLKALARDTGDRYARAGDMQVALTQALHRRWPDFTADRLAGAMKELFAWEISVAEGASDPGRDRLLFQLSRAGVKVDAANPTTSELLDLGTVVIPGATPPPRKRWSRALPLLGVGAALVVAGTVAAFIFLRPAGGGRSRADASGAEPRTTVDRRQTDHLAPTSVAAEPVAARDPEPVETTGPAARAGGTARPARRPTGTINCNSWPWSVVYLDGRRLGGNTPLFRVKVPAGRHLIRFLNPELRLSREVQVQVEAGEEKTVAVSLQPGEQDGGIPKQ